MTANQDIGNEAQLLFEALMENRLIEQSQHLLIAPLCLQNKVLEMIEEEITHVRNGEEGYIGIKINSLCDKVIMDKLVEASKAGVKIDMVIRGINSLAAGVSGETENIKVISIVGRYLEHSRIYIFGTKKRSKIYISSADFMTRNTVRRVEVAAPLYNARIKHILRLTLNDFSLRRHTEKRKKRLPTRRQRRLKGFQKTNSLSLKTGMEYTRFNFNRLCPLLH